MKHLLQRVREVYSEDNENLKEKMFCTVSLVSIVLGVMGLIETIPVTDSMVFVAVIVILLICLMVGIYITLQFHMLSAGSILVGCVLCGFFFPLMFFQSGGIEGGATAYFSLNIIYTCIMFEGASFKFFLVLDIVADVITYAIAYYFPEYVHPMVSRKAIFLDSVYSVIMVGIAVGIMLKLHIHAYAQQKQKVEQQKEELEKASKSKDYFFANMSHEIRTPINTIMGLNEIIIRESNEENTKGYARNIKHTGKMLLNLVNDILDLSQMEMKKMEIVQTEYDTTELFTDLVNMIQIQMQQKNLNFLIDIDKEIPTVLLGDRRRIEQALLNLLSNAVKYTEKGSVRFVAKVEDKNDAQVRLIFSIEDTGIGIRKEDLASLYDIFKRVDCIKNSRIEGSGLGLTITKQLLDLMGGELTVDSIYRKGSIFTVRLTQKIVNGKTIGDVNYMAGFKLEAGENYRHMFEAPEARILVVDDNQMNITIITKLLMETRVQIDFATSGEECLEKTRERYYHVILLDYLMPGMDGVETLKEIRKQQNGLCRDSVVIAMTANARSDAERFYRENGFDLYLEKPIVAEQLEQKLMSCIPEDMIEYQDREISRKLQPIIHTIKNQRKKKLVITTDCVAELDEKLLEENDIRMMYLYIKTDKARFADTREIDSDNLSRYITEENTLAHPDSASVEEYEQFFAENMASAEEIIHISVAAGLGKSYDAACAAAQSFGRVHIVDSKQISCGQSLLVLYGAKLAKENLSADQIIKKLEEAREHIESFFLMPTIKICYQNGYVKGWMNRLCGSSGLHPVVQMKKSRIVVVDFYGNDIQQARKQLLRAKLGRSKRIKKDILYVSHVALNVNEQRAIMEEATRLVPFEESHVQKASFTCACNSGIGTFGFAYFVK